MTNVITFPRVAPHSAAPAPREESALVQMKRVRSEMKNISKSLDDILEALATRPKN